MTPINKVHLLLKTSLKTMHDQNWGYDDIRAVRHFISIVLRFIRKNGY